MMKKVFRILKKIILALVLILLLVSAGLLVYYESINEKTPLPPEVAIAEKIKVDAGISDGPVLLPVPKMLVWSDGFFKLPSRISFHAPNEDAEVIRDIIKNKLAIVAETGSKAALTFSKDDALESQAYRLSIRPDQINIAYHSRPGLFYALTTLKQLKKQYNNKIPCAEIEDSPDLRTRGALLDISRGKVPTLETLYGLVDFLADLKYNHLELYIEGFSFGYPSFKNLWERTGTPILPEEIRKLDAYCKERYIDLVPNHNTLGHMQAWLATEAFKDLAECPDGYKFLGIVEMKTTLAPSNPKSLELVKQMSNDMLPNFTSDRFNVNLDEPIELGQNKDRRIEDPNEIVKIYLEYAKKLNEYVKSKGKKMLMWGDVVSKHPQFISEIPKDITMLEWAYEDYQDFEDSCKRYQEAGLNYMVCPGTSSWTDFTGRTDNMLGNVANAVENGIKYGAEGMLITDWGDTPHLQYLTVSYPGLAYGAALSWNNDSKPHIDLGGYLSQAAFGDTTHNIGNIIMDLGRYNQFEEYQMVSGTMTGWGYRFGLMDKNMIDAIFKKFQKGILEFMPLNQKTEKVLVDRFDNPKTYNPKAILEFVDTLEKELVQTRPSSTDGSLVIDEYKNAIRMIRLGAKLKQYINYHQQQTDEGNKQLLTDMKALITEILPEHERLWTRRNKRGGYETSIESIEALQGQIDEKLEMGNKNGILKWLNGTGEKLKTAIGVLYLTYG